MKNEQNELKQSHLEDDSSSQEQGATVSSRRRLLRAGLKATPIVVATLASRPALACHCVAPSAWGSINANTQIGNGNNVDIVGQDFTKGNSPAGSFVRFNRSVAFDPYMFSHFYPNGSGWNDLAGIFTKFPCDKNSVPYSLTLAQKIEYLKGEQVTLQVEVKSSNVWAKKGKTTTEDVVLTRLQVKDFCAGIPVKTNGKACKSPLGCEEKYPIEVIRAGGFNAAILIAQINRCRAKIPSLCITDGSGKDILDEMLDGTYAPVGLRQIAWTQGQIGDYLHYNWIARRA